MRYCINLAERKHYWIATQAELYQRMADYENLKLDIRDGGRTVTISNPTGRRIVAMACDRAALPFGSVWHGEEELIHVARRLRRIPPLAPGAAITRCSSRKRR